MENGMDWILLSLLIGSFAINVGSQVLLSRSGLPLLTAVFAGCALGFLGLISLHAGYGRGAEAFFTNAVIYASLSYCYFHFINLGETARRVRLLRELVDAGEPLALGEILRRYNARTVLGLRLARLMRKGQIRKQGDRYFIGQPSVLWMARGLSFLKTALLRD